MQSLKRKIIIKVDEQKYLLVNPYTGLADIIDEETCQFLQHDSISVDSDTIRTLQARGHIVHEGDEEDLLDYLEQQAKKLHQEALQYHNHCLIPTYGCNLRCLYCYEKHMYKNEVKLTPVMNKKTVDAFFSTILSMDSDGPQRLITLYGGEPLQLKNKEIIQYILSLGNSHGYTFEVVTNGADFQHFVPLLSTVSVKSVQITLDGPERIHDARRFRPGKKGTFQDITRGIDMAVDHDIPVKIRINVDSDNLDHIPEFADFYQEKGWYPAAKAYACSVRSSSCSPYTRVIPPEDFSRKMIDLFVHDRRMELFPGTFGSFNFVFGHLFLGTPLKKRFWGCSAHTSLFFYDPFGDIYACGEAVGHKEHRIGTFLPELTLNENYHNWRGRTIHTVPECADCSLSLFCGGACAFKAYLKNGSIYSPYCDHAKSSVEHEAKYLYHLMETRGTMLSH
ncbi:MAG: radical SAM protein [Theionarchaea archaeon]|nr:radical SAM protein [Theionarchaea archaeon]